MSSGILTLGFRSRYWAPSFLRVLWVSLTSCRQRAEIVENQTRALIMWVADQQQWSCEWLTSNDSLASCLLLKWRHWLENNEILQLEMGTCGRTLMKLERHWACKLWWALFARGNSFSTPSGGNILSPTQAAISLSTFSGEINHALPEASVDARQDNVDSPHDSPPTTLFASRPITTLKSQEAPRCEVQSVTHKEVPYTPKELLEFSNLYRQKFGE